MPNTRDVYYSESITQGILLEVTESSVWNVLEGSITEHLEQGLCGASAVFLKETVSDAGLGLICGKAGGFGFVKYADTLFNFIDDH